MQKCFSFELPWGMAFIDHLDGKKPPYSLVELKASVPGITKIENSSF